MSNFIVLQYSNYRMKRRISYVLFNGSAAMQRATYQLNKVNSLDTQSNQPKKKLTLTYTVKLSKMA